LRKNPSSKAPIHALTKTSMKAPRSVNECTLVPRLRTKPSL
jgi:hypothetical protein